MTNRHPDGHNVYGHVIYPPGDLQRVLDAVRGVDQWRTASIYTSGFNGEKTLRLDSDRAGFETYYAIDDAYDFFNGGVAGTVEEVVAYVEKLYRALTIAGIECHFEVYAEDDTLVHEFGNR